MKLAVVLDVAGMLSRVAFSAAERSDRSVLSSA